MSRPPLALLFDELVPGNANWPAASAAIGDVDIVAQTLPADQTAWLITQAAAFAGIASDARVAFLQRLEAADPEWFSATLQALYDAYYRTEAAQAQVRRLTEAGPREASPFFDERLLERVTSTQAGKRRF